MLPRIAVLILFLLIAKAICNIADQFIKTHIEGPISTALKR